MKTSYTTVLNDGPSKMSVANARLKLSGSVDDMTTYAIFFDAVRDDILLDAYIARKIMPAVTVQVGQFKTPYGTDNLLPGWRYPFLNRGFLKSAVTPLFRDTGIQLSYQYDRLQAYVALMNGAGPNKAETNNNKSVSSRLALSLSSMLNVSGNYSRGDTSGSGTITEYYDAGIDGLWNAVSYACECGCKKNRGVTSNAVAAWISYDRDTGYGKIPVIAPAVKCEFYDPDTDLDDNAITCCTVGICVHITEKYKNRIMLNYEYRDMESGGNDDRTGIEYLVRY